jgi:protein O-GlcNAc transferase
MQDCNFAGQKLQDAIALHRQNKLAEAGSLYEEILGRDANHFDALHLLGVMSYQTRQLERAVTLISKAVAINPGFADAHSNLGNALKDLKRFDEALASLERAISLKPDYADAYYNRGLVLKDLKRDDEALASMEKAISLKPDDAMAHANRGAVLEKQKRYDEALASFDRAISLNPEYAMAYSNRGAVLQELKRPEEALASVDQALSLSPRDAKAHINRGIVLEKLLRHEEALASFENAIALKPDSAAAHAYSGGALASLRRHSEAARRYERALLLGTEEPFAKGDFLHQKMLCCDWAGVQSLISELESGISLGRLSVHPFAWNGITHSQKSALLCAQLYNLKHYPQIAAPALNKRSKKHEKIRIGYVSGDFRDHCTSQLLVGVLEQHDRSLFDIYIFDHGWDDGSRVRQRINDSGSIVAGIKDVNDARAAATIRDREIDILIHLNGYYGEHRTGIFAHRCAPIQVNYLGFAGTLGSDYIDYIIADRHIIPEDDRNFFSEKVVYLPNCYQSNDDKKELGGYNFSRSSVGLPENGFVFCCFNNFYKIMPDIFDIWMNILKRVEGSVLWILDVGEAAGNLRNEACRCGVEPDRIVSAPYASLTEHLGRHRLADLFLDTLPYNAHTTASDALWAGLPVLTRTGKTFPGRVASSMLTAIGLPELITKTPQAYKDLAVELATNPNKLAAIKRRLEANRLTSPLFDTKLYTRHIEKAYAAMYQRYHDGLDPDDISIDGAQ